MKYNTKAIFVVNINRDLDFKYCLPSLQIYSQKTNADLIVIDKPKYNFNIKGNYNYSTFEKNQIYTFLDKYERILRVDSDVIITPNAPDYFEFDPSYFYVSREDVGSRKNNRLNEIKVIQSSLGVIPGWSDFYFNSGVVLASNIHKEAFNISRIDFSKNLGQFKEQNVLNWNVNNLNFKLKDLGKDFNHTRIFEESEFNSNRLASNIIHYAGQRKRENRMEKDYFKLFGQLK